MPLQWKHGVLTTGPPGRSQPEYFIPQHLIHLKIFTVYLSVSRTNGIDLAVSVEWETVSETAFGMSTFSFL